MIDPFDSPFDPEMFVDVARVRDREVEKSTPGV